MRKLFFFCAFSIIAVISNAQDKIITVNKDTIECRIVSIGSEQISYVQKSSNGYMQGKFIPINQVASYLYFQNSNSHNRQRPEYPWLFRFNPGGSWMPWLLDDVDDMPDYGNKLTKGVHLNLSGHYLFSDFFGVGIQYSLFYSNANGEYPMEMSSYLPVYTMVSEKDKQYINYLGPSIIFKQFLDKNRRFQLSETLSGGMIFYRSESQLSTELHNSSVYYRYTANTLTAGQTIGAGIGLSLEYYLSPSFSISLGGDFLFGLLKKVDIEQKDSNKSSNTLNNTKLDDPLKISRIDYSLGASFYF